MKQLFLASVAFIVIGLQLSCNGQAFPNQDNKESEMVAQVGVYYFHFERRCSTCIAVEENSKKAIEELYPEQVKSGEYFFKGVNLDESEGKQIGDKMDIGMQTLLVVHGDKKVDITGEGFMYVDSFERLKAEVKKAVDKVLKE